MNTEKIKTLEQIHTAIEAVDDARSNPDITREQRNLLEQASSHLWNSEQAIVRKIGEDLVNTLKTNNKELENLSKQISESAKSLEEISNAIANAAKAVGALATILSIAAKSGLL